MNKIYSQVTMYQEMCKLMLRMATLQGDFLSWEKSLEVKEWTLHSKARLVGLVKKVWFGLEGLVL